MSYLLYCHTKHISRQVPVRSPVETCVLFINDSNEVLSFSYERDKLLRLWIRASSFIHSETFLVPTLLVDLTQPKIVSSHYIEVCHKFKKSEVKEKTYFHQCQQLSMTSLDNSNFLIYAHEVSRMVYISPVKYLRSQKNGISVFLQQ